MIIDVAKAQRYSYTWSRGDQNLLCFRVVDGVRVDLVVQTMRTLKFGLHVSRTQSGCQHSCRYEVVSVKSTEHIDPFGRFARRH